MARVAVVDPHKWRYEHKKALYVCSHCEKVVSLKEVKEVYNLGIFNPDRIAGKYVSWIADLAELSKEE